MEKEQALTAREQQIESLLAPTVRALGCEVWGVEYRPRGRSALLRIYIDGAEGRGVTLDDCERVSGQVSALLDVEDPIATPYRLEVSSPGLDRVLFRREHFALCAGERVDVRLAFPFEGRRRLLGVLAGIEGDDVIVRDGEFEYLLPFGQIRRARIVPDFDGEGLAGAEGSTGPANLANDRGGAAAAGAE